MFTLQQSLKDKTSCVKQSLWIIAVFDFYTVKASNFEILEWYTNIAQTFLKYIHSDVFNELNYCLLTNYSEINLKNICVLNKLRTFKYLIYKMLHNTSSIQQ